MTDYPVDTTAENIVRWLLAEQRAGRLTLQLRAARSYASEPVARPEESRFGEDELSELGDVTMIGTLDLSPPPGSEGWVLHIRMEDSLGARLPEDEPLPQGEEEIDLATFEADFIAPGRAFEEMTLEAETPQAKGGFTRLLSTIVRDRHAGGPGAARPSVR